MAVFVHAFRYALCPTPGLVALVNATTSGELARTLNDAPRRRFNQTDQLHTILKRWLLG